MIGNIGGTLGLMIGFSFLTCLEWIGSRALGALSSKVFKWIRARKPVSSNTSTKLLMMLSQWISKDCGRNEYCAYLFQPLL